MIVRRVLEAVLLETLDLSKTVEGECAYALVAVAVTREVQSLLVDYQRVGFEHEGLPVVSNRAVGDAKTLLAQQRGDDVIDVLNPINVEVWRFVDVEDSSDRGCACRSPVCAA